MIRFKPVILLILMALTAGAYAADEPTTGTAATKEDMVKTTDTLMPIVKIETSVGDIVLQLDARKAPISVLNFLQYAKEGYYKDTIFHRVIPSFMIQAGGFYPDMQKKTQGLHDPIANEWQNGLKNIKYTIAMARLGGDPDSATSQFFINVKDNDALDRPQRDGAAYTVFGKVIEGFDIVEKIRTTDRINHPDYPGNDAVTPTEPIIIDTVKLVSKFDEAAAKKQVAEIKAEKARKLEAKNAAIRAQFKDVIAEIEKASDSKIKTTDSGLMYAIAREGSGDRAPTPNDVITMNYEGKLINGHVFDSSYEEGRKPLTYKLANLIPGWVEGLPLIKPGGMIYLIIPPELGYGSRDLGEIPPNSWLIFKVELLGIE